MALSGATIIKDGATYDWYIVWSATQSIANNTSTITARLEVRKMAYNSETYDSDNEVCKIKIANDTTKTSTYSWNMKSITNYYPAAGSYETVISDTYTVSHNEDGTLSTTIYAYYDGSDTSVKIVEGTISITLDTIPRASEIGTISDFNLEDTFSVPVDKKSESFTDDLVIKQGETLIKTITDYTSGANINLTDSELLSSYNAIDKSATFTFETTTKSGSTTIGTDSATAAGTAAGTAYIKTGDLWKRALPYIKVNDTWKKAIASIKSVGSWKRGVG